MKYPRSYSRSIAAHIYRVFLLLCLGTLQAADEATLLPHGAMVKTLAGDTVKVIFETDRIVHVTAWPKDGVEPGPSYVVTMNHQSPIIDHFENRSDFAALNGPLFTVFVDLTSGAVTFKDKSGQVILAEQGRKFKPVPTGQVNDVEVEQDFAAAPEESLFGFGQHQDGIWNWRGLPVQLMQQNTIIAVPVWVSSKGYGVLWDNAARATVNPVDSNIDLKLNNPNATPSANGQPKATEDLTTKQANPTNQLPLWEGTYTTGEAGEYVFYADKGNRSKEFTILIDDKPIASQVNTWVPYTLTGTIQLPAHTTVKVGLRGGGNSPVIGARLRETGQTVIRSEAGGAVDYDFFYGPTLDQVIDDYRVATGAAPMLPLWAYGFWQCRERYSNQGEVLAAAQKYRQLHIPMDLIVQDWQYWGANGWGAYQWDKVKYPDPAAMIQQLHDNHVKFMISIWPNPGGEAGAALKAIPNGVIAHTGYYDAYNPTARSLRWNLVKKAFFDIGTDAWWQDAAEPGDPGNALYGTQTFIGPGNAHALAYPLFHSETLYDGQRAADPSKRVVNLTRSAYSGEQRYSTIAWSGDINGDWITFQRQIPAGLNFSLSGLPYWTTDSGGFFRPGNRYKSPDANEIQARWFEWSTFCPVQRIHGYETTTEFWNWLPQTTTVLTDYDKLRYRMLPYNYSTAWQVTRNNSTIMRPLLMDFPDDKQAISQGNEYMFGSSFLVCPVTRPKVMDWPVYLPKGTGWTNFWTGETLTGGQELNVATSLEQIPLFVRAGAIVPFGPDLQYASEKPADPIELRIYPGADGDFTLYEDEGDSYNYEKGAFTTIPLHWNNATKTLRIGARTGDFPGMLKSRTFQIVLVDSQHGTGTTFNISPQKVVLYDGTAQEINL